jgi:outer membrane protein, heavy metal efflux system
MLDLSKTNAANKADTATTSGFSGTKSFFFALCLLFWLPVAGAAQENEQPVVAPTQTAIRLTSAQFVGDDGLTVEKLVETGFNRRADLLAARQRLAIAEGRVRTARQRPNPTLDAEYGTPRILGGESESDFSVGVTQVFELGGKRSRRTAVAELELQQTRAEVAALERSFAAGIRQAYTNAIAAARQLDVLEGLIAADAEILRATEARLKEGDVAPLDLNLVRVENDRLRVQVIQTRAELETNLLEIRNSIGANLAENIRLAPQTARPPRLDLGINELTDLALRGRADLQAARLGEELGTARINLARSGAVPNVAASLRFSRTKGIVDLPETAGGSFATDLDNEITFGVSVEIPVFNRNQGEIASAVAEREQATRNREFLEAGIRRDVAVAYRKYRAAAESLVLYSTQILPRSEENFRSVRTAYGFGEFSVMDVVAEQRRLSENVTTYNGVLRDYYQSLTELETAIGGQIPASGFAPEATSVLPDKEIAPNQIDREQFLRSLYQSKPQTLATAGDESKKLPEKEQPKK